MTGVKSMRLKDFTATALAFWLVMTFEGQAGMSIEDRLVQATFFSDACRQEAEALGIEVTSDANVLFAAFAPILATVPRPALRADWPDARNDDCKVPAVLLINLLRFNGIDAELVFASMAPAGMAADSVPFDKIDRILVFVTALDRYFDPAAPLGRQSVLDRVIHEKAKRSHFQGPSLANDARNSCRDTCMHVHMPSNETSPVGVKTEVVRGR
jgi:hypothetical protein